MTKIKKKIVTISIILISIGGVLYYLHFDYYSIPKNRIGQNENYPEMPQDRFHHYINLPVDHEQPSKSHFVGFYQFSPNFYKSRNITFLLTDGQMELVNTKTDFQFFENVLKGSAYVVIGVRGHSPTFLPEVYKDGKINYSEALRLYSSNQQVEDIEAVRLDLIQKGIVKKGDKINIFGASGAGVLAQQYLSKYGANVNRVLLESTGAPDLAKKHGLKYSPNFNDFNPKAYSLLVHYLRKNKEKKASICNILYQQGRTEIHPVKKQYETVRKLVDGGSLLSYKFNPITNLTALNYMVQSPQSIMARIRWFELVGYDLLQYDSNRGLNLLYEISKTTLSVLVKYHAVNNIPPKDFKIDRTFAGEVLILKGTEDVVFDNETSRLLQKTYPNAKLLFFKDGHRMQNNKALYIKLRKNFLEKGFAEAK